MVIYQELKPASVIASKHDLHGEIQGVCKLHVLQSKQK